MNPKTTSNVNERNKCTHLPAHNRIKADVDECEAINNYNDCISNIKCQFTFYEEPATKQSPPNTCTHKASSNKKNLRLINANLSQLDILNVMPTLYVS